MTYKYQVVASIVVILYPYDGISVFIFSAIAFKVNFKIYIRTGFSINGVVAYFAMFLADT